MRLLFLQFIRNCYKTTGKNTEEEEEKKEWKRAKNRGRRKKEKDRKREKRTDMTKGKRSIPVPTSKRREQNKIFFSLLIQLLY